MSGNYYFESGFYIEPVTDDYMLVRNFKDFTFDEQGINKLKETYYTLNQIKNIKVRVDICTHDWMIINGKECNNDCVKWDEFIGKLEY